MPPSVKQQSPRPKPAPPAQQPDAAAGSGNLWDMVADDNLRVLIYGQSGSGKTTLAGSFPGTTLWLICSGGDKPGEIRSINTPDHRRRVTLRMVTSTEQYYRELSEACGVADVRTENDLPSLTCRYDNIVLDHASGFADKVLEEIIGKPVPAQKGWGLASQQQYGQQGLRFKDAVKKLLSLSCNGIVIGQERTFGGRDGDAGAGDAPVQTTVGVALSPSTAGWMHTACDYVLQTFKRQRMRRVETQLIAGGPVHVTEVATGETEYCLRCGPHFTYATKFRLPKGHPLPDVIVDPDHTKLMTVIRGEYVDDSAAPAG